MDWVCEWGEGREDGGCVCMFLGGCYSSTVLFSGLLVIYVCQLGVGGGLCVHVFRGLLLFSSPVFWSSEQLMPVLASSLKGSNSSLHIQALTALTAGLKHTPELVTSYLSDILPDCLILATTGATMVSVPFANTHPSSLHCSKLVL